MPRVSSSMTAVILNSSINQTIIAPKPRRLLPIDSLLSNWLKTENNLIVLKEKWWEEPFPLLIDNNTNNNNDKITINKDK
mmetsp:Transcript_20108/g.18260  ORF Transcript_20108/g.18260 Transcript_20108/m.18260 type:complete len:80 (-) Transcript_20108:27-266(-)